MTDGGRTSGDEKHGIHRKPALGLYKICIAMKRRAGTFRFTFYTAFWPTYTICTQVTGMVWSENSQAAPVKGVHAIFYWVHITDNRPVILASADTYIV